MKRKQNISPPSTEAQPGRAKNLRFAAQNVLLC